MKNDYQGNYLVGKAITNPDKPSPSETKSNIDLKSQPINLKIHQQMTVEPSSTGIGVGVDFGDHLDITSVNSTYNKTQSSILDTAIQQT